jgi:peroxiredoxin
MLSELWNVSDYASELSLPIEVVFQDRSRDLAARLLLDAPKTPSDTEKSLEVRLQPVGTVTGRFVHADTGRPVPGVRVSIYRPVGTPDDYWRSAASEIRSDSDGCFRITGVLGGVGHFLSVTDGRYRWVNGLDYQFDGQYGQTHDFGDIELVPLDPPDEARLAPVSAPAIDGFGAEEAYELLVRKYEEDNTAYRELLDVSESRRMQTHVVERREPTPAYAEAFLRLADQQQGTDIELRALVWIASCPLIGGSYQRVLPLKKKAAQRLLDAYTDRKELVSCVDVLLAFGGQASSNSTEAAVATARRLLEENSHRDVQAWTCYGIAQQLVARHARPTDEDRKLAIDFLRRVTKQYSDVPYGHDDTLGAVAERALYELEHLTPGAVAPEIVGVDVDGHELRLSEFRGKMVVLNFWGSWCRPCIQKLDELRVISERYGDNVVVLGVMTDSPESARPAIQQHQVRFRNWIDGIERGPIASQWNVKAWPTVYVIDPLGVIRWKDADGGSLADAVWSLQRRTHSRH